MTNEIVLKTNNLTKRYGKHLVVDRVSLNVKKGRIYGLLGRNGAGKTSVMKMILGLISISHGDITVFNEPLRTNQKHVYPKIGSIIEMPGFYSNLTGTENLNVFAQLRGPVSKKAIETSLAVVDLPYNDHKKFESYSLGMKQRLGLAYSMLNDPEILILDEPTNGLDPIGIAEIRTFLKRLCHQEGKTIIISSHILAEIEMIADDIGIIHEGVLLEECTLNELKKRSEQYILIQLSDVPKAVQHLETVLGIMNYSIEDNNFIRIYDLKMHISHLGKSFLYAGFEVNHLELRTDNLEDYFKKITGGVGIA